MEDEHYKKPEERVTSLGWIIFFSIVSITATILATMFITLAYGYALYIGVPGMLGFVCGFIMKTSSRKNFFKIMGYIFLITFILCLVLIAVGIEGAICIMMIFLPLYVFIAIGYLIGMGLRTANLAKNNMLLIPIFLLNPALVYVDMHQSMSANTVTSTTTINASAAEVWQVLTHKVNYSEHTNLFFKLGVNYPKNMALISKSDSTFLRCELRNGHTDLWVNQLVPGSKMRFELVDDIIPVKELTIYDSINTPHNHAEYFKLHFGEFSLQPIDASHCKLIATSDFSYRLSPSIYWQWWSNYLVDKMHSHVLEVIKQQAEHGN